QELALPTSRSYCFTTAPPWWRDEPLPYPSCAEAPPRELWVFDDKGNKRTAPGGTAIALDRPRQTYSAVMAIDKERMLLVAQGSNQLSLQVRRLKGFERVAEIATVMQPYAVSTDGKSLLAQGSLGVVAKLTWLYPLSLHDALRACCSR